MSRILCFVQAGASYQYSADRMSRRPSLLKSATATLSLNPGSTKCIRNAISAGRDRTAGSVCACATMATRTRRYVSTARLLTASDDPHDVRGNVPNPGVRHLVGQILRHDRRTVG